MKLVDAVSNLAAYDEQLTVYAKEPWTCDSEAIVARELDDGGIPPEATAIDASYFIEVFVANEFLDGWRASQQRPPTDRDLCERLIRYATDDA